MNSMILKKAGIGLLIGAVMVCMAPVYSVASTSYSNSTSGGHGISLASGAETYDDVIVTKTGDSSSEDADFYGDNAAVLCSGGTLTLTNSKVTTNGSHANGIFAYGSGATVNVSNTSIKTSSNNSGGIMTTGGATMNATDLTVNTSGNSSAAIRSDRGGGDVNVSGGIFKTTGVGSPAIYSTADIDVEAANLASTASEAVVIEGGNSVTLDNCVVSGDNTTKNGKAKYLNNVLIYQSMSGDASTGSSSFAMNGGVMTSKSGAMFHVTNTTCNIDLNDATLNLDEDMLLTASADDWGTSGNNGGNVTLNASDQTLAGIITVDSASSLILNLKNGSTYTGRINTSGQAGSVSVNVESGSSWTLTGDTYVSSLSNDGTIYTNGHTLYVNGVAYTGGTAGSGVTVSPSKGTVKFIGGIRYKVTTAATGSTPGTVKVTGLVSKSSKSATIKKTVTINGYKFKVTAIAAKAFYKKSKLRTITISSTTISTIGSNAFKGIYKKAKIKLPSSKYKSYKELIESAGAPSGVKYKKIS